GVWQSSPGEGRLPARPPASSPASRLSSPLRPTKPETSAGNCQRRGPAPGPPGAAGEFIRTSRSRVPPPALSLTADARSYSSRGFLPGGRPHAPDVHAGGPDRENRGLIRPAHTNKSRAGPPPPGYFPFLCYLGRGPGVSPATKCDHLT